MNPYYDEKIKIYSFRPIQKKIQEAILDLIEKEGFDKVTVKEVSAYCHIARSTFYYYYDTPREALDDLENNYLGTLFAISKDIINDYIAGKEKVRETADKIADYTYSNKRMLLILLVKRPDALFLDRWTRNFMYTYYDYIKDDELRGMVVASTCLTYYKYVLSHDIPRSEVNGLGLVENVAKTLTLSQSMLHNL